MNILTRSVLLATACVFLGSTAFAQSPVGLWRTIDDDTGEPKSLVEIYEQDGKLYGKIAKLLPDDGSIPEVCEICEGEYKDKPLVGAVIIKGLERDGDEWEDGTITDPANGKTYSAKMSLEDANTLDVRGFIKVPLMGSALGRTQTWYRVTEEL